MKETNWEQAVNFSYEDYCTLRAIAVANETDIPHLVRYWMMSFLDARKNDLKDEHLPR